MILDFENKTKEELVELLSRIKEMLHGDDAGDIVEGIADLLDEDLRVR